MLFIIKVKKGIWQGLCISISSGMLEPWKTLNNVLILYSILFLGAVDFTKQDKQSRAGEEQSWGKPGDGRWDSEPAVTLDLNFASHAALPPP